MVKRSNAKVRGGKAKPSLRPEGLAGGTISNLIRIGAL
jgi:hypothetical protein